MRRRRRVAQPNLLWMLIRHPAVILFARIFLAAAVVVAIAGGAFYYIYNLPYFKIAKIQIKNDAAESSQLLSAALNNFIGRNILQPNILSDIKRAVERLDLPHIKKAVARRYLPDTVIVEIVSRKGAAQIEDGARFYIVDEEGFVFGAPKDLPYPGLAIIEGVDREDIRHLKKTIKFLRYVSSAPLFKGKTPSKIDASSLTDIYFWIDDIQVRFGEWGRDAEQKLAALDSILADLAGKETKPLYIDLRFDKPVIGPR